MFESCAFDGRVQCDVALINEWSVSSDGGDSGYESVKPTLTTLRETWGGSWGRQAQDQRPDREAMSPMV